LHACDEHWDRKVVLRRQTSYSRDSKASRLDSDRGCRGESWSDEVWALVRATMGGSSRDAYSAAYSGLGASSDAATRKLVWTRVRRLSSTLDLAGELTVAGTKNRNCMTACPKASLHCIPAT
jgi:hypothetical protein